MSAESFFNEYTSWLQPNLERSKEKGDRDYYNSPLMHFDYENINGKAYQVNPRFIISQLSILGEDLPLTLDKLSISLGRAHGEQASIFKHLVKIIFFNEAFLHIKGVEENPLLGFFNGIDSYMKSIVFKDWDHATEIQVYNWLLESCLAITWAAHQRLKPIPELSESSRVDATIFESCGMDTSQLLEKYEIWYHKNLKKIKTFLINNLNRYLSYNACTSNTSTSIDKNKKKNNIANINRDGLPNNLAVSFSEFPFNKLFHIAKNGNNLDFSKPNDKDYFTFYSITYSLQPLFRTLLLIDLHKQIDDWDGIEASPEE